MTLIQLDNSNDTQLINTHSLQYLRWTEDATFKYLGFVLSRVFITEKNFENLMQICIK